MIFNIIHSAPIALQSAPSILSAHSTPSSPSSPSPPSSPNPSSCPHSTQPFGRRARKPIETEQLPFAAAPSRPQSFCFPHYNDNVVAWLSRLLSHTIKRRPVCDGGDSAVTELSTSGYRRPHCDVSYVIVTSGHCGVTGMSRGARYGDGSTTVMAAG